MVKNPFTVVSLAGLTGFLDDAQQAIVAALAGMDVDAPRSLAETAELLDRDPEALFYDMAMAWRAILQGIANPDPEALRLQGAHFIEGGVAENITRPGIYSLQGIVPALRARRFPSHHALTLVNLWTGGVPGNEAGTGIRLRDPEGAIILESELAVQFTGLGGIFVQAYELDVTWPSPGLYTVEIWLVGAPFHAFYLPVYEMVEDVPSEEGHASSDGAAHA